MDPRLIIGENTVNFEDATLAAHAREAIFQLLVEHQAVFRVRGGDASILVSPAQPVKFMDTDESRAVEVVDDWVQATVKITLFLGTFTLLNEDDAYKFAAEVEEARSAMSEPADSAVEE